MAKRTWSNNDRVFVINQTMGGTFVLEGKATVIRKTRGRDGPIYDVWFHSDLGEPEVPRFIDWRAQKDPARFVDDLNAAL